MVALQPERDFGLLRCEQRGRVPPGRKSPLPPSFAGRWIRKLLWLVAGMLLLWAINLGRLTLVFWAGQRFGEHFAIDVLHPYIGLVTFTLGVGIMILCIRPMGLRIGNQDKVPTPSEAGSGVPSPVDPGRRRKRNLAVPKVYLAVSLVLVLGIIVASATSACSPTIWWRMCRDPRRSSRTSMIP